jgi:predicted dehydrogenase
MAKPPLSRRGFLGAAATSAAAGLTVSPLPRTETEASAILAADPVRIGLIGLGTRGTTLLRTCLTLPEAIVVALSDAEPHHLARAEGIAQRSGRPIPTGYSHIEALLAREDLDAVLVALPCDLHAQVNAQVLAAGRHLYGEKPLALTLEDCHAIEEAAARGQLVCHVGFQKRSSPRYQAAAELIQCGRLGEILHIETRFGSSNGPLRGHHGWLGQRARSGDWMLEFATHTWDVWQWLLGELPQAAVCSGHRRLFADSDPARDVTDSYTATLMWKRGTQGTFRQSWIDPPDSEYTRPRFVISGSAGTLDLVRGTATFRQGPTRQLALPPDPDTETALALKRFVHAVQLSRSGKNPESAPCTLREATEATVTGMMVRLACDEQRVVTREEVASRPTGSARSA